MVKRWTFFGVFLLIPVLLCGQKIKGRVFDVINQLPLSGANIQWKNYEEGTSADESGYFELEYRRDTLRVSFVGYQTSFIIATEKQNIYRIGLASEENILADVVITAFNMDSRQANIPASVGVISKKDFQRDNKTTIVPSINRIPGVFMQSGAYNTNRLTIRGIGSRSPFSTSKIRAYFKGIPLTTGDGETTIEDTDLELISRAEVIRGPASSIYGAGLGGTVLLQMAEPTASLIGSEIILGSYGLLKSNTFAQISSSSGSFGVNYNYMHSDGYRDNNTYDRQTLTLAGTKQLGANSSISLLFSGIDLLAFIPSSIDSATFASNPRAAAPTWANSEGFEDTKKYIAGAEYQHFFNSMLKFDVSVFLSGRDSYELRPFNILDEESSTIGLRSIVSYGAKNKKTKTTFGLEYFYEQYDWKTYQNDNREKGAQLSDNKEIRKYLNLFGQVEYTFSQKVAATFGLNVNKTGYDLEDLFNPDSTNQTGKYQFEVIPSPRLALSYRISKGMIFGTISYGFSPPSFSETLAPNGLINPNIKPEKGINYEIGYKGFHGNLGLDFSLYTMKIEDLIVARRVLNDQFIGLNAGKTSHTGLELEMHYEISIHKSKLIPFVGYTLSDYIFVEFKDGDDDYSGNALTGVPDHVFNIGVDVHLSNGIYGNLTYHDVGEMPLRDDNSDYSERYGITSLKIGFNTVIKRWEFDIHTGVNNVFDITYASMIQPNAPSFGGRAPRYYYPGLPVNYFGGFGIKYSIGN